MIERNPIEQGSIEGNSIKGNAIKGNAIEGNAIEGKKIVLGVTGGIAAFKIAGLASLLIKNGAEVRVVMTAAAKEFITPRTFQEITKQPVSSEMFGAASNFHVEHIALANFADLVVIAPATANFLAKAAHGIADDLLTTMILATTAPIMIAPSMNDKMFANAATQENLSILRRRGFNIIEPAVGHLACGTEGRGRLPEPIEILERINSFFARSNDQSIDPSSARSNDRKLEGKRIIVTASGTIEPIDPVRYIGNRSSGKTGFALAEAAHRHGARVLLVTGPSALESPRGVETIRIETALEMREAVLSEYARADAVIMSAAVADYRAKTISPSKIKKSEPNLTIELEKNPDILRELGQKKTHQILIGFAAETDNLLEYAALKLEQKNLNFIVANDVTVKGAGFNVDTNVVTIISRDGSTESFPMMPKSELAELIIRRLEKIFD